MMDISIKEAECILDKLKVKSYDRKHARAIPLVERCGNCYFGKKFSDDIGHRTFVKCKRYPPNPVQLDQREEGRWLKGFEGVDLAIPRFVSVLNWCGEWEQGSEREVEEDGKSKRAV